MEIFLLAMDSPVDWDVVLKGKYISFNVEIEAYLDSVDIATSTQISASKIYDAIKDDESVHPNLKLIYKEYLFGTNKEVRARIKNRITNFRRTLK